MTAEKPLGDYKRSWVDKYVGFGRRRYHVEHALSSIFVTALYGGGMIALVAAPLEAFAGITADPRYGTVKDNILTLTPCGETALKLVVAGTFFWSAIVGGFARSFLRTRFVCWPLLAFLAVGTIWGLTTTLDILRRAASEIAKVEKGSNLEAAAFIAFWALTVSFAAKALWDEIRDRISAGIDARIPKQKFRRKPPSKSKKVEAELGPCSARS